LIYELLISVYTKNQALAYDLTELIKYVQIACNSYPHNAIDNYYSDREKDINELLCKALDESEILLGNSTLNISASLDQSPDNTSNCVKQRTSMSIFDNVEIKQNDIKPKVSSVI